MRICPSLSVNHPNLHAAASDAGGWLEADIPPSLICKPHHTGTSARLSMRDSPGLETASDSVFSLSVFIYFIVGAHTHKYLYKACIISEPVQSRLV